MGFRGHAIHKTNTLLGLDMAIGIWDTLQTPHADRATWTHLAYIGTLPRFGFDWAFSLMTTRTKLASVCFVAARSCITKPSWCHPPTYQILCLPGKMILMIDPCHIWNVVYNKRSNSCQCPNSPNTAPATILVADETLFTMRWTTGVILQHHQILRLARKITRMTLPRRRWNVIYSAGSTMCHCPNSPNTAHPGRRWKRHLQCGEQRVSRSSIYSIYSTTTKYHSSISLYYKVLLQSYSVLLRTTKYYSVLQSTSPVLFRTILYYKVLQNTFPQYYSVLGSATKYYSVLKSPRWNAIDIARSNRCHPPASPNTAPATKSHCHHWSLSHMKRQMAYCHCTPFCVRLSYSSARLLSLCMHSHTLNEVFHIVAIRASKFTALRAMHFPMYGRYFLKWWVFPPISTPSADHF